MSEMYGNVKEVLSCDYVIGCQHGLLSYFQISYPNTTIKFKYDFCMFQCIQSSANGRSEVHKCHPLNDSKQLSTCHVTTKNHSRQPHLDWKWNRASM